MPGWGSCSPTGQEEGLFSVYLPARLTTAHGGLELLGGVGDTLSAFTHEHIPVKILPGDKACRVVMSAASVAFGDLAEIDFPMSM